MTPVDDSDVIAVPGYEIIAKLGEGGMGLVYEARHVRLDRPVAIKVLPPEATADPVRRRRFVQEAQAASALNHPNIITIHDIVEHNGRDYIVMELVEGRTLHQAMKGEASTTAQALRWATQIAEALAVAHAKGIVHRDLKPSNVMIVSDGRVKVLDFGLAKLQERDDRNPDDDAATRLTEAGSIMGTPHYMSPEQALGNAVDARSDIFSLGVLMYEMLAGTRPFSGDNHIAVMHAICSEAPVALDQVAPSLPPALGQSIQRALDKSPDRRQQSMDELLAALRSVDMGDEAPWPVTSGAATQVSLPAPPAPTATAAGLPKLLRNGFVAGLAIAAVAVAIVVTAWVLAPSAEPGSAIDLAAMSPFAAYETGIAALERSYQQGNIELSIEAFENAIGKDPEYAAAYAGLAMAQMSQYGAQNRDPVLLDRAMANASRAVEIDGVLAAGHVALGTALLHRGDGERTRAEFDRALQLDPRSDGALAGIALLYEEQGETDEAIDYFNQAIEIRPDYWRHHSNLGTFHYGQGSFVDAEAAFNRVAQLAPDNFVAFQSLGGIYYMTGRSDEAATALQRALEIRPDANVYSNLGTLFFSEARYDEAIAAFERAVDLRANHYLFWGNLADAYRWAPGRRDESIDPYRTAIQLLRQTLEDRPDSVALKSYLAEYLAKSGVTEEALGLTADIRANADESPDVWFSLAKTYELGGQRDDALDALRRTLTFGYPLDEVAIDPELTELRQDVRYRELLLEFQR